MKVFGTFFRGKKGQAATQESMMVPIQLILGASALLLLLGIAITLFLVFTPGKDDIAQAQFENFVLNVQSLGNDQRDFLTRTVQFDLEDGFLITIYDKNRDPSDGKTGNTLGHNIDNCREEGILIKPERSVGSTEGLPDGIEADPQCFRRSCACLYKINDDIKYSSGGFGDQPERIRCLPLEDIDAVTSFTQEGSTEPILSYLRELESDFRSSDVDDDVVAVVTTKIEAIESDVENDLTDIDDELTFLASDLLSKENKLADKGFDADGLAQGIRAMANGFSNIVGGDKNPHYPEELLDREYGDVLIYGKCNERPIAFENGVMNVYLEKYRYINSQNKDRTTLFVGLDSPLVEDRKENVQNVIVEAAKRVGDESFSKKQFRAARENYEQALQLDFSTGEFEPEIAYKLAYTYWQTFNEEEALARFEEIANRESGHYESSVYRLYAQLMIASIHEHLATVVFNPTESDAHLASAREAYTKAIAMFASWGSEKSDTWNYQFDSTIVSSFTSADDLQSAAQGIIEFGFVGEVVDDSLAPGFWRDVFSSVGLAATAEDVTLRRTVSLLSVHAALASARTLAEDGDFDLALEHLDSVISSDPELAVIIDPLSTSIQREEGFATLADAHAFISARSDPEGLLSVEEIQNIIGTIDWSSYPEYSFIATDMIAEPVLSDTPVESGFFVYGEEIVSEDVFIVRLAELYMNAGVYTHAVSLLEDWPTERMDSNESIRALFLLASTYDAVSDEKAADVYALLAELDSENYAHKEDLILALVDGALYFAEQGRFGETRGALRYVMRVRDVCQVELSSECEDISAADFLAADLSLTQNSYGQARNDVTVYLESEKVEQVLRAHYIYGVSYLLEDDSTTALPFFIQNIGSRNRDSAHVINSMDQYVDYCRQNSLEDSCSGYEVYRRTQ